MNQRPGGFPPSPPQSVGRSSTGTGLLSISSQRPGEGRKYSAQAMEDQLLEHHRVLKDYLQSTLDANNLQTPNRARDKLLRLSAVQFQELSTDVFDELCRREDERRVAASLPAGARSTVPKYLLAKDNFHPKRNQARQKLSTLQVRKFRELATDVLYELERRFPKVVGGDPIDRVGSPAGSVAGSVRSFSGRPPPGMKVNVPNGPNGGMRQPSLQSPVQPYSPAIFENGGRPMPKQFQSNTMVPNKGTMVEDDDESVMDDDGFDMDRQTNRSSRRTTNKSLTYSIPGNRVPSEYQSRVPHPDTRIDELEAQLRQKDEEIHRLQTSGGSTDELEAQLRDQEAQLKDHEARLRERETQLRNQDTQIREQETQLESTQSQLQETEARLRQQDAQLRAKDDELDALQSASGGTAALEAQIAEKNEEIAHLRHAALEIDELEEQLQRRDDEIARLRGSGGAADALAAQLAEKDSELEALRAHGAAHDDMQRQLQSAEDLNLSLKELNTSLQAEIDRLRGENGNLVPAGARSRSLSPAAAQKDGEDWQARYELLEHEFHAHQQLADEVRQDAAQSLQEMRLLASQSAAATAREEELHYANAKLEAAVAEWKTRYTRARAQLRSLRGVSSSLLDNARSAGNELAHLGRQSRFASPDGLVQDVSLSAFQTAVDELLRVAHGQEPAAAAERMRPLVAALKSVTAELGVRGIGTPGASNAGSAAGSPVVHSAVSPAAEGSVDEAERKARLKLKGRISSAANQLITTTKAFATSDGLVPVSLVDVAAGNLTVSVVELVKMVKIRLSAEADLIEEDDERWTVLEDDPGDYA